MSILNQQLTNKIYCTFLNKFISNKILLGNILNNIWLKFRWNKLEINCDSKKIEKLFKNKPFEIPDELIIEENDVIFDFLLQMITLKPKFKILTTTIYLFENDSFYIPITYLGKKELDAYILIINLKKNLFKKIEYPNCQNIYSNSNLTLTKISFEKRFQICMEAHLIFYNFCLSKGKNKE